MLKNLVVLKRSPKLQSDHGDVEGGPDVPVEWRDVVEPIGEVAMPPMGSVPSIMDLQSLSIGDLARMVAAKLSEPDVQMEAPEPDVIVIGEDSMSEEELECTSVTARKYDEDCSMDEVMTDEGGGKAAPNTLGDDIAALIESMTKNNASGTMATPLAIMSPIPHKAPALPLADEAASPGVAMHERWSEDTFESKPCVGPSAAPVAAAAAALACAEAAPGDTGTPPQSAAPQSKPGKPGKAAAGRAGAEAAPGDTGTAPQAALPPKTRKGAEVGTAAPPCKHRKVAVAKAKAAGAEAATAKAAPAKAAPAKAAGAKAAGAKAAGAEAATAKAAPAKAAAAKAAGAKAATAKAAPGGTASEAAAEDDVDKTSEAEWLTRPSAKLCKRVASGRAAAFTRPMVEWKEGDEFPWNWIAMPTEDSEACDSIKGFLGSLPEGLWPQFQRMYTSSYSVRYPCGSRAEVFIRKAHVRAEVSCKGRQWFDNQPKGSGSRNFRQRTYTNDGKFDADHMISDLLECLCPCSRSQP